MRYNNTNYKSCELQCNITQNQKELAKLKPEPLTISSQNLWGMGRFLPSSKEQKLDIQNRSGGLGAFGDLSDIFQVWWW